MQAVAGVLESALLEQRPLGTLDVDLQQVDLPGPGAGEQIGDGDQIDFNGAPAWTWLERGAPALLLLEELRAAALGADGGLDQPGEFIARRFASRRSNLIGSGSAATISADGNRARRYRTEIPVFAPRSTIVLGTSPAGTR